MMADLVRNDLSLREISWSAVPFFEFVEEAEVEINFVVGGAIERSHCGLRGSASRAYFISEQNEPRALAAGLRCCCFCVHYAISLSVPLMLAVRPVLGGGGG
ncbi:MAG: hypothetical protein ACI8TX_001953 [Hyphomicrobiaceae bacterium]|jgi:hypothetical protein